MTDPETDPTRNWIEDASRGDDASISHLLDEFLPDLQAYVRRHAGRFVLAGESSADIVQSICRELLEHLGDGRFEYRGVGQFRKWLYRAALLKISARRRFRAAAQRDPAREQAGVLEGTDSRPGIEPLVVDGTPSRVAALNEELDGLQSALEQLPANYTEVITLAQIDGLSHAEIASRLEITESHSRVLLARALARLATLVRRGQTNG